MDTSLTSGETRDPDISNTINTKVICDTGLFRGTNEGPEADDASK